MVPLPCDGLRSGMSYSQVVCPHAGDLRSSRTVCNYSIKLVFHRDCSAGQQNDLAHPGTAPFIALDMVQMAHGRFAVFPCTAKRTTFRLSHWTSVPSETAIMP